jgi:hypothetical protein
MNHPGGKLCRLVGALTVTTSLGALASCTATEPRADPTETPTNTVTQSAQPRTLTATEAAILRQFESGKVVPRHDFLLGGHDGLYLCSMKTYGSDGPTTVYAVVNCGTFSTGVAARSLSGSTLQAVLTISGTGAATKLLDAQFPRQSHIQQDQKRMFPADVLQAMFADQVVSGTLLPTHTELLEVARAAG